MVNPYSSAAKELAPVLLARASGRRPSGGLVSSSTSSQGGVVRHWSWVPAIAGGVSLAVSGVSWLEAKGEYERLTSGHAGSFAGEVAERGQQAQLRSAVTFGVGLGLLGASVAMYALGGPRDVSATVATLGDRGGWGVVLGGTLP